MMEADERTKNQFKLIRELEDVGQYILHLGKFTKREEKVHVKISKKKYYSADEYKYNKEILALKDLNNHPSVVKFHAAWIDTDHELRIILEYTDTDISRVMKKRGRPFTEAETRTIMTQVFEGLSHIHKKKYMHRALKPSALKCDQEATVIKISDFSNALALDVKQMVKPDIKPVWYMPPEMLLSLSYSTTVDMWSAGCIMAELLTGKPLLNGDNEKDQLRKMCYLLGTFSRSIWPQGYQEVKANTGDYNLPMVVTGEGLSKYGTVIRPDASEVIMSVLQWVPDRRPSSDKCLTLKFFVDESNKDEIIQDAQQKLQYWQQKWEPSLNKDSMYELGQIIGELSPRKEKQIADMFDRHDDNPRKSMTNYDQDTNRFGVMQSNRGTPRQSMELSKSVALDDYLSSSRMQARESARNSPSKDGHTYSGNGMQQGFTGHQQNQGSPPSGAGPPWLWKLNNRTNSPSDDPFRPGGRGQRMKMNPYHRSYEGFENPIAHKQETDRRDVQPTTGRRQMNDDQIEKLKSEKPWKYRDRYGDSFMNQLLGDKPTGVPKQAQSDDHKGNFDLGLNTSPNEPRRNRKDDFHNTGSYEPSWREKK